VAVNLVTNKIYVASGNYVSVIDDASNATTMIAAGTNPALGGEPGHQQDLRRQPGQ